MKKNGFTLVEIIVVLLIIASLVIFSYIVVPPLMAKARDAERKSDFDHIGKALEEFYETEGCFPSSLPGCREELNVDGLTLLDSMPCDPKDKTEYVFVNAGAACNSWYQLYTNLEILDDPSIIRIRCDEGCGPDCAYNYGISSTNKALDTCKPPPELYACGPGGACILFADPERSSCPIVFIDDPTCIDLCDIRENRCHDESGKKIH